jgi:sulfotransferase family protein
MICYDTQDIVPVFVLGSPRSGTTMIGHYLGSSPDIADFQELGVFFFSHSTARRAYKHFPTSLKESYLSEVERHAIDFAIRQTRAVGRRFFCDSTPRNLLIVDYLSTIFPHAIFVLTLRHYVGVIQSLERAYRDGWKWAGSGILERACVWTRYYAEARKLPLERTVLFGYDRFCAAPGSVLEDFHRRLAELGISTDNFSLSAFERSHATTQARSTIGLQDSAGRTLLQPMPSFDRVSWTDSDTRAVEPEVGGTEAILREMFPEHFGSPAGWIGIS